MEVGHRRKRGQFTHDRRGGNGGRIWADEQKTKWLKESLPWTLLSSYSKLSPSALFSAGLLASTHILLAYPTYSSQSTLKYKQGSLHSTALLEMVQCLSISLRRESKVLYDSGYLVLACRFYFTNHSPRQLGLASSLSHKRTKASSHLRDAEHVLSALLFQIFSEILFLFIQVSAQMLFSQKDPPHPPKSPVPLLSSEYITTCHYKTSIYFLFSNCKINSRKQRLHLPFSA